MKIAIGMITRNEREILEHTMFFKGNLFDYKFAVDFGSTDGTQTLLGSFGFDVHAQQWVKNYATARNILIQMAEEAGMDYIFMLDADEAMFDSDLQKCVDYAEMGHEALTLARVEFVQDFHHTDPSLYPDHQTRFFRLNKGNHFRNKVHEMLFPEKGVHAFANVGATKVPFVHIFHYGRLKDKKKTVLKYVNYDKIVKGETPLKALPAGFDWENAKLFERCVEYTQPHPLQHL